MIKSKTVFVIGAGASCELNFPSGSELLRRIEDALDWEMNASTGGFTTGDKEIYTAILGVPNWAEEVEKFIAAAERVRKAAHLGRSIDNLIHQHKHDDFFGACAKFAIGREILKAEHSSPISTENWLHSENRKQVRDSWLGGFVQLLVQDVERESLPTIFDKVQIVCFNYDRSIQHFLPLALQDQFGISKDEAERLVSKLKIQHPYGHLGALYGHDAPDPVRFGDLRASSIWPASTHLRTFTENLRGPEVVQDIQTSLTWAHRVVFLGFGFIPQNMRLLMEGLHGKATQVLATGYGIPDNDWDLVTHSLAPLFPEPQRGNRQAVLQHSKCGQFMQDNFRFLSS